jgi:hypothetical protein
LDNFSWKELKLCSLMLQHNCPLTYVYLMKLTFLGLFTKSVLYSNISYHGNWSLTNLIYNKMAQGLIKGTPILKPFVGHKRWSMDDFWNLVLSHDLQRSHLMGNIVDYF